MSTADVTVVCPEGIPTETAPLETRVTVGGSRAGDTRSAGWVRAGVRWTRSTQSGPPPRERSARLKRVDPDQTDEPGRPSVAVRQRESPDNPRGIADPPQESGQGGATGSAAGGRPKGRGTRRPSRQGRPFSGRDAGTGWTGQTGSSGTVAAEGRTMVGPEAREVPKSGPGRGRLGLAVPQGRPPGF